ncbi:MAG: response regulator, partial [bacterium]
MESKNHIRTPQVIVVDDAGIIRMSLSRLLEREGYRVKLARNGMEAVADAERLSPDAMLIDLRMPSMSGLDLVRIIKNKWPEIEIVIITAYADSDMIRQTREHGAME